MAVLSENFSQTVAPPLKTIWKQWQTNSILYHNGQTNSPSCPLCYALKESCFHVLQFFHQSGDTFEPLKTLHNHLRDLSLAPLMFSALLRPIVLILTGLPPTPPKTHPSDELSLLVFQSCQIQNPIGWHRLTRGFVAHLWNKVHNKWSSWEEGTLRLNRKSSQKPITYSILKCFVHFSHST